jgi:hypothetical protein
MFKNNQSSNTNEYFRLRAALVFLLLFAFLSVSVAFAQNPYILGYDPGNKQFVDPFWLEGSYSIRILFSSEMNRFSVLKSMFLRQEHYPDLPNPVPEIPASLEDYLRWFGPNGIVEPYKNTFDLRWNSPTDTILEIMFRGSIKSPPTGNMLRPGGKYTLTITRNHAKDKSWKPLGLPESQVEYTFYVPGYGNVDLSLGEPPEYDNPRDVTSGDGLYVIRHVLGLTGYNIFDRFANYGDIGLSANLALEVADVDDSGDITSGDGLYIIRHVLGVPGYDFPVYQPPTAPGLQPLENGDEVIVSIGELEPGTCDSVKPIIIRVGQDETEKEVPINICNVNGRAIDSADFWIEYDPDVVLIKEGASRVNPDLPGDWILTDNPEQIGEGIYKVNVIGTTISMTSDGILLYVTFETDKTNPTLTSPRPTLEEVTLEDIEPGAPSTKHPVEIVGNRILLPVELSAFSAFWHPDGVRIFWQAESQRDNLGWNIYRSESKDGKFVKINGTLIKGAGTTSVPMKYNFIDKDAKKGKTYYYYLEDVSYNGEKNRTPSVKSTPLRLSTSWGAIKRSVLR